MSGLFRKLSGRRSGGPEGTEPQQGTTDATGTPSAEDSGHVSLLKDPAAETRVMRPDETPHRPLTSEPPPDYTVFEPPPDAPGRRAARARAAARRRPPAGARARARRRRRVPALRRALRERRALLLELRQPVDRVGPPPARESA